MRPFICFDIETSPLPNILDLIPPFVESEVRYGNIKDPEKIAAKIAEARANHATNFINNACLDARFCRVLAIGIGNVILCGDEPDLLKHFWKDILDFNANDGRGVLVGYYSHKFDLPMLLRRSWANGIMPPAFIRQPYRGRSYWWDQSIDLHEHFTCGDRECHTGGLDGLAKFFGLPGKVEIEGGGAKFHELWVTDNAKAEEYLRQDVKLTEQIAVKMGIL